VKQDATSIVEGSLHQKIAQLHAFEIGNELHIKAGMKVVIEAGSEMTLKAGGSFIKLDASGVSLVGPKVNINSGGSPGSGSGYGGQQAALPNGLELQQAPEEISPISSIAQLVSEDALIQIALSDIGLARMCQRQPDGSCPRTDCPCKQEQ
ncbi:type VI secretion system tip protein VgrG, partial [Vibrio sp. M260112]